MTPSIIASRLRLLGSGACAALLVLGIGAFPLPQSRGDEPADSEQIRFFEQRIRPLLVGRCYACHSAETKPAGGLRVDDFNGLLHGGSSGPSVVPGDAQKSLILVRVLEEKESLRMPQGDERLSDEEIADLKRWIETGAAWPVAREAEDDADEDLSDFYEDLRKDYWAFQPLNPGTLPQHDHSSWPRSDVDRFVLAGLESAGLTPVADADRETLLRRVTFDLIGLPPSETDFEAFLADEDPRAFEKVVDRLLASSAYGERWGRHWLDTARYGESTGPSRNIPYPHAWRYRDYVIDSVNDDVPIDRFIQEQIAGDLIAAASPQLSGAGRDRLLTATGYLALGVKDVNQRFKVRFEMDNVDEQIDVVTRGILGLTVSCARCHDHKFDPIPTADYYALAGIFTSTVNAAGVRNKMGGSGLAYYDPDALVRLSKEVPPPAPEEVARLEERLRTAKQAWDAIRGTPEGLAKRPNGQPVQRRFRVEYEKAQADLAALTDPASRGAVAHGVFDAAELGDTAIRLRGEAEKLGPLVPRGFLTAFEVAGAAPVNPQQSGRLELAAWLTSPNNSLAARVAANRIWQDLFGTGLVATADNFGYTGATPSNQPLLDHISSELVRGGWSRKALIRQLVLSRTYQLSSLASPEHLQVDPGNRLHWRHSPRRLSSEELRDAALAAAGVLDRSRPEASPASELQMIEMNDNGAEAKAVHAGSDSSTLRSVYLPLLRGVTPRSLECFDPAEQTLVTVKRESTTVPSQALFLLNSDFIAQQALRLTQSVLDHHADDRQRVRVTYLRAFGRTPTDDEISAAIEFTQQFQVLYARRAPQADDNSRDAQVNAKSTKSSAYQLVAARVPAKDGGEVEAFAAWNAFHQSLLASAEFRFVR